MHDIILLYYLISFNRPGQDQTSQGLIQQLEHMTVAINRTENEIQSLNQELVDEKTNSRQRHSYLIDDLTKALQVRDVAIHSIKNLESYCIDQGIHNSEIHEVRVFIFMTFNYSLG